MRTSWGGSRSFPSSADDPQEQHGEAWLAIRADLDPVRVEKGIVHRQPIDRPPVAVAAPVLQTPNL